MEGGGIILGQETIFDHKNVILTSLNPILGGK